MRSHRPILARPLTALAAAAVFVASVLLLPIDRYGPSFAGRTFAMVRDEALGRARSTYCIMPYAQKLYTLDGRGRFVEASDELLSTMPAGVPMVVVSADTFLSGKHGLWAPTSSTWQVRISVDTSGLTPTQAAALRAQFVDELAAAGAPAIQRDQLTLRTADINRRKTLWSGYLHNAASLASFLLFAISAPLATRRAWRAFRTPPGHCPHCRYDLRATPPGRPCPECGRPQ